MTFGELETLVQGLEDQGVDVMKLLALVNRVGEAGIDPLYALELGMFAAKAIEQQRSKPAQVDPYELPDQDGP